MNHLHNNRKRFLYHFCCLHELYVMNQLKYFCSPKNDGEIYESCDPPRQKWKHLLSKCYAYIMKCICCLCYMKIVDTFDDFLSPDRYCPICARHVAIETKSELGHG